MRRFAVLRGCALGVSLMLGACSAEEGLYEAGNGAGRDAGGARDVGRPRDTGPVRDAGGGGGGGGGTDAGGGGGGGGGGGDDGGGGGNPPGREVCDNGLDDNRDGRVDEGCACLPGDRAPCWPGDPAQAGRGTCTRGTMTCEGSGEFGMWGSCTGAGAPELETCDERDNDCDDQIDEGCICMVGQTRRCYGAPPATRGVGLCRDGMQTCARGEGGQNAWGPCEGSVRPSDEICDGFDNNCDGRADDGCECMPGATRPCYDGPMGSHGVGACRSGTQRCLTGTAIGSRWGGCEQQVLPSGERCDDRMDNDCDGVTDCADAQCMGSDACRPCSPGGERFTLSTTPAEVMFVVDRSGSMLERTPDRVTRWDALTSAVRAVLPSLDRSLFMGLLIYPEGGGLLGACSVAVNPHVPITQPAAGVIASHLASRLPDGNTPTYDALQVVARYFNNVGSTRRRFVVLATDGAPNCNRSVNDVVSVLRGLRGAGVDTFVLGIPGGSSSLYASLNLMADAGGRARTGSVRFYEANSTSELETGLRAITASASSCTFRLGTTPSDPARVTVQFDGTTIARDRTNGWEFTDTSYREIRFFGSSCTRLQGGAVLNVSASFNC